MRWTIAVRRGLYNDDVREYAHEFGRAGGRRRDDGRDDDVTNDER